MARLRNDLTGAVMTVDDSTAELLGSEWGPVDGAERSESPDASWKVADLKAYAADNGVNLGDATKKDDILSAINGS